MCTCEKHESEQTSLWRQTKRERVRSNQRTYPPNLKRKTKTAGITALLQSINKQWSRVVTCVAQARLKTWWRGTHIRIGFLALLFFNWTVYGLYIKYQNRKGLDWWKNSDWLKKRQKGRDANYQTCRVGIGFLTLYIIKKGKNFWVYFLWYFYQLFLVTLKIKKKKVFSFLVTIYFLPF